MQKIDQQVFTNSTIISIKKQLPLTISHKCIGGNLLYQFCFNPKCEQKNNFICHDQQCQCYQKHQLCMKSSIKVILKKINQKLFVNTDKIKNQITAIFTNLINKISEYQQFLLKQADQKIITNQLTDLEKRFLQIFVDQKIQNMKEFDGIKLQSLLKSFEKNNSKSKAQQLFESYLQKIKDYEKMCIEGIQKTKKQVNKIDNLFKNLNNIFKLSGAQSSIIINDKLVQNLVNFFLKKIKSIKLVFKASQNNFLMQKYYQKCSNLQNTIILVQTQKNKIIGGYTPLNIFPINNQDQWVADTSRSSFAFSLTNNDKFQLKNDKYAIYRYNTKLWLNFGNILYISDQANINKKSGSFYDNNNYYSNTKYPTKTKQSYLKFHGTEQPNFIVKQWEAFNVEFQ